ncbi:cache domain-containing protein [Pseudomonas jilinensis]|uniref:Histidine kinase n=1 Tax=Pseudomonas jilinensis TaxID=2078689 RepID=A0A396RV05_9PSED|nr:cache domain-containing protein [Pseudomonas jilinensis]RHW20016.1 histidine kinase [Pseudomonas jilinensis]
MAEDALNRELQDCISRIDVSISNIFAQIDILAREVCAIWQQQGSPGKAPAARDLKSLRPLIDSHLAAPRSCLQGTGVVLEPNVLQDQEMYCEWRHLTTNGRIAPLDLNFNRSSDSYYNYRDMPWFTRPRSTGQRVVIGPYIDLYGQDTYILTFAQPLNVDGRFIGIAGADIALGRFERILVSGLLKMSHEAFIVTDEGRVVAANTANWTAGELARHAMSRSENHCTVVDLGEQASHWALVQRPCIRQLAGAA